MDTVVVNPLTSELPHVDSIGYRFFKNSMLSPLRLRATEIAILFSTKTTDLWNGPELPITESLSRRFSLVNS